MHAGQHVHQRRLAGAVLAEQHMHLAGLQVEIDAAQRVHAAETLGDASHGQQRRVHSSLPYVTRLHCYRGW